MSNDNIINDGACFAKMNKYGLSACMGCTHSEHSKDGYELICPAFPDGIPEDITNGANRHTSIHKKQTGDIVFERYIS